MIRNIVEFTKVNISRRINTVDFRIEVVKQVRDNGYSIKDTVDRLGMHLDFLRSCKRRLDSPGAIEQHIIFDLSNA